MWRAWLNGVSWLGWRRLLGVANLGWLRLAYLGCVGWGDVGVGWGGVSVGWGVVGVGWGGVGCVKWRAWFDGLMDLVAGVGMTGLVAGLESLCCREMSPHPGSVSESA